MKETKRPIPKIEPYVTAKGGVVILNGPFPLDQAEQVRNICEAAPEMLEALKKAKAAINSVYGHHCFTSGLQGYVAEGLRSVVTAIAKAEGRLL